MGLIYSQHEKVTDDHHVSALLSKELYVAGHLQILVEYPCFRGSKHSL